MKKRKGTKLHAMVNMLGNLLALHVTAASKQALFDTRDGFNLVMRTLGGTQFEAPA